MTRHYRKILLTLTYLVFSVTPLILSIFLLPSGKGEKKARFFNCNISGSDFKKIVKSRSRILNEGLGVSVYLGFCPSVPLKVNSLLEWEPLSDRLIRAHFNS